MAKYRLTSDGLVDVDFSDQRLTSGGLVEGSPRYSINLITDTSKGILVLSQDGSFTYDFDDGTYTAPTTDFFTYTITDVNGTSNVATVEITILDDIVGTVEGTLQSITGIANAEHVVPSFDATVDGDLFSISGDSVAEFIPGNTGFPILESGYTLSTSSGTANSLLLTAPTGIESGNLLLLLVMLISPDSNIFLLASADLLFSQASFIFLRFFTEGFS